MAIDRSGRPVDEPHPSRLPHGHPARAEILARHATAIAGGDDGYLDPLTGHFVFTAEHLSAVGTCCNAGCRHCPYLP